MALGKSLFKSSIKPCPPREVECYVCEEIDFSVAKDEAVNGYICSECILDAVSAEMAMIVAQRIVESIAKFPFNMDGEKVNMTISGGMSEYPRHSEQIKDLIEFADQAMYKVKKQGGNSVFIYQNDNNETDKI